MTMFTHTTIRQRHAGFTLVELMVTVVVLGLLLSVAVPSFRDLLAAQRLRSAANSLVSDLLLARSEALKRGRNVVLVPVASSWVNGWTIEVEETDETLGQQNALGGGVDVSDDAPSSVVFNRNGRLTGAIAPIELTSASNSVRCISMDISGRPKSSSSACPS